MLEYIMDVILKESFEWN